MKKSKAAKKKKKASGRTGRKIHPDGGGDFYYSDDDGGGGGRLVYGIGEILWNPDDFRRRRSKVVRVSGAATSGGITGDAAGAGTGAGASSSSSSSGVAGGSTGLHGGGGLASVVNALRLEEHLSRVHGTGTVPRGVINVIGASDMLDRFVAGEVEGEMGELPDGISPEEAIARLMMVFSRGICAAAGSPELPAVVVTGGFDVGPSVSRGGGDRRTCFSSLMYLSLISLSSRSC